MSETKWMKAPWRLREPDGWPFRFDVLSADGLHIVDLTGPHSSRQKTIDDWRGGVGFDGKPGSGWTREDAIRGAEQTDANAHLIASAPDLYAALATLQHYMVDENPGGFAGDGWMVKLNEQATAALSKARGER